MIRIQLTAIFVFISFLSGAQQPYEWSFTAKPMGQGIFEIHCTVNLSENWHIYSQHTPANGPLPTQFGFTKSPIYHLEGPVMEKGRLMVKNEPAFGVDVQFFEKEADFIQKIKLNPTVKTNLTGSVEFMICNDSKCLPPTIEKFSIPVN